MSLVTWNGKLLLTNGKLTIGPADPICCCVGEGVLCLQLTGNLTMTVDAPGCDFDGQEITLIDRSLGLGDDWWSGAEAIWLAGCLTAEFSLRCLNGVYLLTTSQVAGSTPCSITSQSDQTPSVQTLDPFHLEFENEVFDADMPELGECECCDPMPGAITFVIEPA